MGRTVPARGDEGGGMILETGPGPRLRALHNMSAPPRTRITVRPLRPGAGVRRTGPAEMRYEGPTADDATVVAASTGLVPVALLSPVLLTQHWFPTYVDEGPVGTGATWKDKDKLKGRAAYLKHLRLRCLVVLSRIALGELRRPNRESVFRLARARLEALEAAYLENVRRLDPLALSLPPFGFAKPITGYTDLVPVETDPARALALLSRCSGTVFSAGREPLLPDYNRPIPAVLVFGVRRRGEGEPDD